jgi:hypothetical protein
MPRDARPTLTAAGFAELAERLGAFEPGVPDVAAAARLVRHGRVVSAGDRPAEPSLAAGVLSKSGAPTPYRLTQWAEHGPDWSAVNDRVELDIHGAPSMTHLDTVEHFRWDRGSRSELGDLLALAAVGLVGRGVLIDVPGVLGPITDGQVVEFGDVQHCLAVTGVALQPGDTVYISFGRLGVAASDAVLGQTRTSGLGIECAEWLASMRPSVIVTDEGLDCFPSEVGGQSVPWHLLVLTVLGIPLVDRASLTALSATARELGRWEFLSVIAPLPIPAASGSPVNPLAIF